MNVRQLSTLIAIVDSGSFVAAGEKLGLSQSAVSLQIKTLEDELGVLLFDRSGRPPKPSSRGRVLAEQGRRIVALMEEARQTTTDELVRGKLTVGAVLTSLSSFLPGSIKSLRREHPNLRLDVRSGRSAELADQLLRGELDVVICTSPEILHPGLVWHDIATEPFVVIAPVHVKGCSDEELLTSLPFIWFNRTTWAGRSIERELTRRRIQVCANMEIDALDAISSLVGAGLGVSIVPVCFGARPLSPRLQSIPFGDPVFCRKIGALTQARTVVSPQLAAFLATLQQRNVF